MQCAANTQVSALIMTAHMLQLLHKMALLWKHKYAGLPRSLPFCKMSLILRQIGFWDYGDIFWKDPLPSISSAVVVCGGQCGGCRLQCWHPATHYYDISLTRHCQTSAQTESLPGTMADPQPGDLLSWSVGQGAGARIQDHLQSPFVGVLAPSPPTQPPAS